MFVKKGVIFVLKITPFFQKNLYGSKMAIFSLFLGKNITPKLKKFSYRSNRNKMHKKGVIFAMKITPK